MLNLFRLGGDLAHVASIFLLILRLRVSKNANGISMKTQELYLLVFVTRYLDLLTTFYSLYNTLMKIMYISATGYILYMVRMSEPFKTNYDSTQDSFLHWKFAVAPVAVLALITSIYEGFDIIEVRFMYYLLLWLSSSNLKSFAALLGLLHLPRATRNRPSADSAAEISRGRKSDWKLCFFLGILPFPVHPELGVPRLPRAILPTQLCGVRVRGSANVPLYRFFLLFL